MRGTLWNVWEQTVAAGPDRLAAVEARTDRRFSRAELTAEARYAALPPEIQPGVIAAFALPNGVAWLATFLAVQRAGAAALPLDASLPGEQQAAAARGLGATWLATPDGWRRLVERSAPPVDACLVKTTSGTTGQPQALWCTTENMLADGRQIASTMEIGPDDINLGAVPFGHSYGLGNLVLPLIVGGTAVVCSAEMMPEALAGQIERCGVTVFPSAPAIFRALAESSTDPGQLVALRRVISAGAPLPPAVAQRFRERFGMSIHNFYGSSETGGICFDRTGEATLSGRSVGPPLDGVTVELTAEGRIAVLSAAVIGNGSHVLPDLGQWSEQGELRLTGRVTALANIGGKKVAPQEIEAALRDLAGVTDAWVGVRTRLGVGGGDYLLAAVETRRSPEEIRQELGARLPPWQVPRRLWASESLPRTARGKLDRAALEARGAESERGTGDA